MGHVINYITCDKNASRKSIIAQISEEVEHEDWQEGGSYHGRLTWHENKIYDCIEDAEQAISEMDDGRYDDHAVLFKDVASVADSKEVQNIDSRIASTKAQREKFIIDHSVKQQKANYIGCTECGSKVAREYLKRESCPVCGHDLRAPYILEKIAGYDAKIAALRKQRMEAKKKQASKAKVCWLVKYEYHI